MSRHSEDSLILAAFEDTPAPDNLDPSAQLRLAEYCRLRDELRNLRDVPAPQISKERLRDALLAKSAATRPTTPWWAVAAGVSFAAVAVTAAVLLRPPSAVQPGPVLVASNSEDRLGSYLRFEELARPEPWRFRLEPVTSDPAAAPASARRNPGRLVESGTSPPRSSRRRLDPGSRKGSHLMRTRNLPQVAPVADAVATVAEPPSYDLKPNPDLTAEDAPLILVSPEVDEATGAPRATEVESANNVLVGG